MNRKLMMLNLALILVVVYAGVELRRQWRASKAREAARHIGSEYVVTYRPKRPLANAKQGEYRNIEVAPRRTGLTLRSRRGYVVPEQSSAN